MNIENAPVGELTKYGVAGTAVHWLLQAGFDTVGKVAALTDTQLASLHGIGSFYQVCIRDAVIKLQLAPDTVEQTGVETCVVRCEFNSAVSRSYSCGEKRYAYLCDIPGVKVGDKVVVDAPSNGLTLVTVREIAVGDSKASKWIVDRVDLTAHEERRARAKRKAEIEAKLEAALKEELRKDRYARLASKSPELLALVEELNNL